ncbi:MULTISPECIES: penicillin-binding protein [unclassified Gordonia (in: high G+C Gram-positive bacteria)]|uniref:penicillin-binding protein n=1 Tax=Gordonia TaxID=2053 RepID=UPI00071CDFED|nr:MULTISPECIES: penicillin-binding protein [unclassified Gordonia (in: high G+C Gram-positive bacteria)]KSU59252.1 penicillin-binding protein [Gordonia sp. SGD-V-85]MBR7191864.1 penicillin-binding protein [Gordonia sp. SCSIO 19800]MDT0221580.1 penicillin-binding protein [Gordonia sp. AC31]SCC11020.1 Membrane carboxypeptidase (penicillin-binding protein) [Gordonia sp. v-85]
MSKKLWSLAWASLLAGVLVAGLLYPVASGIGVVSNRAAAAVENVSSELLNGTLPEVTTMTDVDGKPIAVLFDQYRYQVGYNDISPDMIRAIISVEDRRFLEHDGVDWKGTIRAALKNSSSGEVQQGASTLDQQYIKNYQLLVLARTEADRQAAIETTPARKLREVRMALTLEQTLIDQAKRDKGLDDAAAKQEAKKQIVTRYLNVVPFGNNAYGIEAAAQTYFGIPAKDLRVEQAALLAGMVQSSSALNPYSNPEASLARRNIVLDTMIDNFPERRAELVAAKEAPLGVLPSPRTPTQGCIAADNNGFFCDYALQFLAENGMSRNSVLRGGYIIQTTLDPEIQRSTVRAVKSQASPTADGVADVMSTLRPGKKSHDVLSMASSRDYGLDLNRGETMQPQPFSMVGDGAGSVFKIFTVAAAMEKGLGAGSNIPVPGSIAVEGMGNSGGANGCPANAYCVKNDGRYPASMSVTNALAQSPNTAFVKLLQQVGVKPAVDMAVRLGLRSYTIPGSSGYGEKSMAQYVKDGNFGSFTLGPLPLNGLELANVAATIASGGTWCPPNPIKSISQIKRDQYGNPVIGPDGRRALTAVPFTPPPCEQVVDEGLAHSLANAMSKDDVGAGTAAGAAGSAGWTLPMSGKTGTTEAHRSSAFVGFTNQIAGAAYVYSDGPNPQGVCSSPLRSCYDGDLYGGMEPARTWFQAVKPVATKFGPVNLPPIDREYWNGSDRGRIPQVSGLPASEATSRLQGAGFKVSELDVDSGRPQGTVVFTAPSDSAMPGSTVTIYVSNGRRAGGDEGGPTETTVVVPGVGPVVIQLPG